ncbi:cytochrome d ubiquinol oxidase subunit II [Stackebrandtia endophytica]|uniref:Cytochrome d ubiquinol oxidase subunit II n=1 Tax=Stackebrandtia endophytica TaxID=1496996 RepID=A0A543AY28_9ACTN|nr:cytochrome d ubiquinol oxidase subunit II [Stackebrandtia endophytica]TQL77476.1 cytochrome d ubiquinol oxidase subunit II [Stackebrandtia endophytica]
MVELFYLMLGLVFGGYFALAGYDYGVGILLRTVAKTDTERRLALGALGPFFLGNEVWLVAGLGLFIGAFPIAEGQVLSGLYPVLIPLMAALLIFTAAVQVRSRAAAARPLWDLLIVICGFIIAAGWGAALGVMLQGFPIRFGPLPVVMAALTTALFTLHGAILLKLRTGPTIAARADRIARGMGASAVVLALVAGATAAVQAHRDASTWWIIGLFALLAGVVVAANRMSRIGRAGVALVGTGVASAAPALIVGIATLPHVYLHADPVESITLTEAAASSTSLDFLAIAVLPVLPVLVAFQAVTWWIWRKAPGRPLFY